MSPFSSENNSRSLDVFDTLRPMASLDPEEEEDPIHIVLSRDTSLILELDFIPSPDCVSAFDALKIPFTRSVNHLGDQKGQQLLSFQILLVDALTGMFVPVDKWVQEDNGNDSPSLVDFQAEESIIDLRDGKAVVCFKLPCCFLDSLHRTGRYR